MRISTLLLVTSLFLGSFGQAQTNYEKALSFEPLLVSWNGSVQVSPLKYEQAINQQFLAAGAAYFVNYQGDSYGFSLPLGLGVRTYFINSGPMHGPFLAAMLYFNFVYSHNGSGANNRSANSLGLDLELLTKPCPQHGFTASRNPHSEGFVRSS